ncbi:GntR family transcriptional regulator [Rhodococcus sp. OK611]|uniref:GntR family transcriptional regulator n=1 Tax=unclassified Rhodococcus (in: high G+C Gram-positive bacteria) TaxID=192944 RepID=UPI000BCEB79F|nr:MULTISPECIES: GntR family transcriptional regulator [unclassified Rhodococcus (in: high G+C Gram-positive bacteria)]PTR43219.1 GntR family transcriptional regulator [Rhodococcus sp. OK611]SNX91082.1 GntR family transcriptional regulator [Rhodococcus sp. OK270]
MTRQSRLPKYLAIYDDLRARIDTGEWQSDDALPAQRELAASYGVTIMTLRQALQLLENDGLIEMRPGAGTFPANKRYTYNLLHLSGFADDLRAQGANVATHILGSAREIPPPEVARSLHLGPTEQVLVVTRHRVIDTHPSVLQYSYIPRGMGISPDELVDASLYQVLAQHGYPVASANESITVTTLGAAEAELLARPEQSPAMLSRRTNVTEDGTPVLHDTALIPSDIAEIHIDRGPQQLRVTYRINDRHT